MVTTVGHVKARVLLTDNFQKVQTNRKSQKGRVDQVEKQRQALVGVPQVDQLCKLQAQVDQLCSMEAQVDHLCMLQAQLDHK